MRVRLRLAPNFSGGAKRLTKAAMGQRAADFARRVAATHLSDKRERGLAHPLTATRAETTEDKVATITPDEGMGVAAPLGMFRFVLCARARGGDAQRADVEPLMYSTKWFGRVGLSWRPCATKPLARLPTSACPPWRPYWRV
jgi:hypothetical protein